MRPKPEANGLCILQSRQTRKTLLHRSCSSLSSVKLGKYRICWNRAGRSTKRSSKRFFRRRLGISGNLETMQYMTGKRQLISRNHKRQLSCVNAATAGKGKSCYHYIGIDLYSCKQLEIILLLRAASSLPYSYRYSYRPLCLRSYFLLLIPLYSEIRIYREEFGVNTK